jgi:hypothetical protein
MATSTGLSTVALKVSGLAADPTIRPAASEAKEHYDSKDQLDIHWESPSEIERLSVETTRTKAASGIVRGES